MVKYRTFKNHLNQFISGWNKCNPYINAEIVEVEINTIHVMSGC